MPSLRFFWIVALVFFCATGYSQAIYNGGNGDGFSLSSFSQAANPLLSLYQGGSADGFALNSFAQADNVLINIYQGGLADGFALANFAQADNVLYNIYGGGLADGFALSNFAQADNVLYAIYGGGIADGFALNNFAQADNVLYAIYAGGIADGFALNNFAQANNILYDIYKGGVADGFALAHLGSIGGEVPLPVTLVSFDGRFQDYVVLLTWKTASEIDNDYFLLERSPDGATFTSLYRATGAGTSSVAHTYSYADEAPFSGLNYYRLKQVDFDGGFNYSKLISVYAETRSIPTLHVYPNPSPKSATVRIQLTAVSDGTPVEVNIVNAIGERIGSLTGTTDSDGLVTIPDAIASKLSGGLYVVTVKAISKVYTVKWIVE